MTTAREAIRGAQLMLKESTTPGLVADGTWGARTDLSYAKSAPEVAARIGTFVASQGYDVAAFRAAVRNGKFGAADYSALREAAESAGIKGASLINLLATVEVESGFRAVRESHNYTQPGAARSTFAALRGWTDSAVRSLVTLGAPAFFEAVYGFQTAKGRALGNVDAGDGFKYRGGGMLQITGRSNYILMSEDTGVDFASDTDLTTTQKGSIVSAIWYWKRFVMARKADSDINRATAIVNPAMHRLSERVASASRFAQLLA